MAATLRCGPALARRRARRLAEAAGPRLLLYAGGRPVAREGDVTVPHERLAECRFVLVRDREMALGARDITLTVEGASADVVKVANERANIPFERILEAEHISRDDV